jgi:adenine/guanine phosphoribosyltransferase-like PRPP-binding protein
MKHTLKNYIPVIPDFPRAGINFLDITKILCSPEQFQYCVDMLTVQAHGAQAL